MVKLFKFFNDGGFENDLAALHHVARDGPLEADAGLGLVILVRDRTGLDPGAIHGAVIRGGDERTERFVRFAISSLEQKS